VRRLLRFLFADQPGPSRPTRPPNAGSYYRSAAHPPLSAGQVRAHRFAGSRRSLDPDEVHTFLHRVANELAAVRTELARTRAENARIKDALRDWQSRFTPGAQA